MRGARPSHKISWWKDGRQLSHTETSVEGARGGTGAGLGRGRGGTGEGQGRGRGGTVISSTIISPEAGDEGAVVVCRADTPGLGPASVREHKWQLPVHCE